MGMYCTYPGGTTLKGSVSFAEQLRNTSLNVQPEMRCNHQELVERLLASKPSLSPIWQYPFFHQRCLRLDWLHLADLGVTAALAGSILCLFVDPPGFPNFGPTIEDRRLTLWHMLLDFYKEWPPD